MDKNIENNPMNHDIFAGQWKQMRGALKSWWGKLSDDDFEWIEGQKNKLIGLVEEKYGYTRDQAREEVDRRFNEYDDKDSTASVRDMTAKVYELGETAASKARGAVTALADEFATAGSSMQENKLEAMATDLRSFIRKYPFALLSLDSGSATFYFATEMTSSVLKNLIAGCSKSARTSHMADSLSHIVGTVRYKPVGARRLEMGI
jgi:uncharacterized protein YjbJ (UPF0337 family)